MGKLKKKGMSGEANRYISRNKAVRKLQLNLHSFNRLCIIKGLFPIEPKNRIKAQRGDSKYRPLFLKKDIRFLMHDPLIWTVRKEQSLYKKLRKARHKHDATKIKIIKRNKPVYRLDQNVLERYPRFIDAIKDLADPLTMIFLFSNIKVRSPVQEHHVSRCQRLRMEFLTYVIEAQCLTKAFIATKGYYYEVEILGHKVVWTVPHNCVTEVPRNADLKIMRHFLEFYIAMLGFVNFRLLSKVNLRYPLKPAYIPKLMGPEKKDLDNFKNLLMSLNYTLDRTQDKQQTEDDETNDIDSHLIEGSTEQTQKAYTESLQSVQRRKLFRGLKFFISQENNRESLTLVIRSCGGEVSWPSTMFPCSTFTEDDQTVTHQIVDRPNFEKKYLSRYYVQPQWVYDSLNTVTVQPCQLYLPDAVLPPHVCPFLKNYEGWYVPPEEETLRKLLDATPEQKEEILRDLAQHEQEKLAMMRAVNENVSSDDEDEEEDDDDEEMEEDEEKNEDEEKDEETQSPNTESAEKAGNAMNDDDNEGSDASVEEEEDEDGEDSDDKTAVEEKKKKETAAKRAEVRRGREFIHHEKEEQEKELGNEYKMRAFMIHKKNRKLYNKLRDKEARQVRLSTQLKDRREAIELHKIGKMTEEQLENLPKPKLPKRIADKKKQQYRKNIVSAVKFSKSKANKHRNKK